MAEVTPETKPTAVDLAARVKAAPADVGFVTDCRGQAFALVDHRIGETESVPAAIRELAVAEVATDLYWRRRVRNGVANFDGPDMAPVRVTRDPMKAAEDVLAPYLGPGIA